MRNERDIHFDAASGAWFGKSMPVSRDEMEGRVWRFGELVPSPRAFLDCTLPGHVRTLYSALGAGADDEQLEGTAVEQAVNYHIDFVKAPPGNGAALHSHGSEETFVALTGRWESSSSPFSAPTTRVTASGRRPSDPPLQTPRNQACRLRDARGRLTPTEDSPGCPSCRRSGAFPASRRPRHGARFRPPPQPSGRSRRRAYVSEHASRQAPQAGQAPESSASTASA